MKQKVEKLLARLSEVEHKLGHPAVFNDQKAYRELTQEHSYLQEVKTVWEEQQLLQKQIDDNRELLKIEQDPDFAEVLREDLLLVEQRLVVVEATLQNLLVPPTLMTAAIRSWNCAQERVAMRRRSLWATACACTSFLPTRWGGATNCSPAPLLSWVVLKNM